jgi:MarR family transcriptional regulator, lower aerobic nicotinate degradation pathway regulator
MPTEHYAPRLVPPQRLWRLPSWLVNQISVLAYRLVIDAFSGAGFRRDHYAVLSGLEEYGPISQAALCRRLGIDRSDMVAVLNLLEHDGHALRRPDPTDQRRNAISITAAGRRTLRRLDGLVARAQDELLGPLSARERRHLVSLLQRLVDFHVGTPDGAGDSVE